MLIGLQPTWTGLSNRTYASDDMNDQLMGVTRQVFSLREP